MLPSERRTSIAVKTSTIEEIINGEMNTFLHAAGFLGRSETVKVQLPFLGETFMLPIVRVKEFDEERLVLHIL